MWLTPASSRSRLPGSTACRGRLVAGVVGHCARPSRACPTSPRRVHRPVSSPTRCALGRCRSCLTLIAMNIRRASRSRRPSTTIGSVMTSHAPERARDARPQARSPERTSSSIRRDPVATARLRVGHSRDFSSEGLVGLARRVYRRASDSVPLTMPPAKARGHRRAPAIAGFRLRRHPSTARSEAG